MAGYIFVIPKAGSTDALLGAAMLFLISLVLAALLSIDFTGTLNVDLGPVTGFSHRLCSFTFDNRIE